MVNINEEAHIQDIRLLKQIQSIQHEDDQVLPTKGLFVLDVKNTTKTLIHGKAGGNDVKINTDKAMVQEVVSFDGTALLSQETLKQLTHDVISSTNLFAPQTINLLGEEISTYLLSRFRFNNDQKNSIIIVVEVNNTRIINYRRRKTDYVAITMSRLVRSTTDYSLCGSGSEEKEGMRYHDHVCSVESEAMRDKRQGFIEVDTKFEIFKDFDIINNDHSVWIDDQSCCSICLEGFKKGMEVAKMDCSHVFHKDCVLQWLPKNGSCPMCRSTCVTLV